MTEREVVLAAMAVAIAAAAAVAVPSWVVGLGVIAALVRQRPFVVIVALVLAVGTGAARGEAGLVVPPGSVSGTATVASDPEPRPGGSVLDLRLDGHRYRSFVGGELSATLADAVVGDEVEVSGRVSELRGPWEWRASRHLSGSLTLRSALPIGDGAWWWRSANAVRRTIAAGLGSFEPDERALFLGVVIGDDRAQSELERFRFRSSGLSHLMAVSGQNVAFMLVAVSPVLRRLRLGWRWVVTLGVLVWFALVTRLEPSVLRAVAMALVASTAAWRGRFVSGLRVVAVAVIVLLVIDPLLVWSVGFRLSVGASVALVTLARPLSRRIPGPRLVAEALAVTLAAQVGTAPLLLGIAGSVPALGPVFNLVAVPVAGWLMIWGIVTAPLAGVAGGPVASVLGWPSRWMARWLAEVAAVGSDPGLPRLGWAGVVGMSVGVVGAAWLGSGWGEVRSLRRRRVIGAVVMAAMLVVPVDSVTSGEHGELVAGGVRVWAAGGSAVMQVGSAAREADALALLLRCRCDRLDAVIVTGGGRTASSIVWDLRQVIEVGVVAAGDSSTIRDAVALVPGRVDVGTIRLRGARSPDGKFEISSPP